ncbi:MAG: hypothetical protein ACYCSS_11875, partial [Sulfuriferula sp.]
SPQRQVRVLPQIPTSIDCLVVKERRCRFVTFLLCLQRGANYTAALLFVNYFIPACQNAIEMLTCKRGRQIKSKMVTLYEWI